VAISLKPDSNDATSADFSRPILMGQYNGAISNCSADQNHLKMTSHTQGFHSADVTDIGRQKLHPVRQALAICINWWERTSTFSLDKISVSFFFDYMVFLLIS
jgi:hypothetical protein